MRKHNDLVMLRGEDAYDNLPSKTVMLSCCLSEIQTWISDMFEPDHMKSLPLTGTHAGIRHQSADRLDACPQNR